LRQVEIAAIADEVGSTITDWWYAIVRSDSDEGLQSFFRVDRHGTTYDSLFDTAEESNITVQQAPVTKYFTGGEVVGIFKQDGFWYLTKIETLVTPLVGQYWARTLKYYRTDFTDVRPSATDWADIFVDFATLLTYYQTVNTSGLNLYSSHDTRVFTHFAPRICVSPCLPVSSEVPNVIEDVASADLSDTSPVVLDPKNSLITDTYQGGSIVDTQIKINPMYQRTIGLTPSNVWHIDITDDPDWDWDYFRTFSHIDVHGDFTIGSAFYNYYIQTYPFSIDAQIHTQLPKYVNSHSLPEKLTVSFSWLQSIFLAPSPGTALDYYSALKRRVTNDCTDIPPNWSEMVIQPVITHRPNRNPDLNPRPSYTPATPHTTFTLTRS
jgi:hypothetical protein